MKYLHCCICMLYLTAFTLTRAYSQARTSVSLGAGANHPLQSGYRFGKDITLQGNIRLSSKWLIAPAIGIDRVKGGPYDDYAEPGRSIDLFFLKIAGKYYLNQRLFGYAAPALYLAGDNLSASGIGGAAGAGYDLHIDDYSTLEFTLHAGVRPVYDKTVPVAGLGAAYKFNFTSRR